MRISQVNFQRERFYHVYNHSPLNSLLFREDSDYQTCIGFLQKYLGSQYYQVIAYCLMPNHYHLLFRQVTSHPISEPLNTIWGRYSRYYNKKYLRFGSIFCQKLQHVEIKEEQHLLSLCAYIHLNPVKAGLVEHPGQWKWSNYLEWLKIRNWGVFSDLVRNEYYENPLEYQAAIKELTSKLLEKKYLHDE